VAPHVSAPTLLHKVEPQYSEEAQKAGIEGTVVLYGEVGPEGLAHNLRVIRSMGHGLDESAIEAVTKWRFRPGEKDGKPVTVAATFEVNFRLLRGPLPKELAEHSLFAEAAASMAGQRRPGSHDPSQKGTLRTQHLVSTNAHYSFRLRVLLWRWWSGHGATTPATWSGGQLRNRRQKTGLSRKP
jgi:TonB family protein